MRRFLVRAASRFFLHGKSAQRQALQAFPAIRGRTTIIDFGDWNGCFPDTIARQDARATLALAEDDHVFLFLGQCRRYKNLDVLIETFARLPEKAVLIVAGRFRDSDLESSVRRAIGLCDRRVILDSSFVPHDAVQIYLRACDAVVAPYSEVLTSGTAVLAASFGRPMIAPAIGFLPDIVTPETGILYDRERADGLEAAMLTAMRTVFDERKIRAAAKQRSWQRSADTFIAACREIVTSAA